GSSARERVLRELALKRPAVDSQDARVQQTREEKGVESQGRAALASRRQDGSVARAASARWVLMSAPYQNRRGLTLSALPWTWTSSRTPCISSDCWTPAGSRMGRKSF